MAQPGVLKEHPNERFARFFSQETDLLNKFLKYQLSFCFRTDINRIKGSLLQTSNSILYGVFYFALGEFAHIKQ